MTPEERFWNRIIGKPDDCLIWQGYLNQDGYGRLRWKGKLILAHVLAYNLEVGEVPEGLELDHKCRARACVNVEHLEPVTHKENMVRGISRNAKKTHCKNGHEFDFVDASGARQCHKCKAAHMRRKRAKLNKGT